MELRIWAYTKDVMRKGVGLMRHWSLSRPEKWILAGIPVLFFWGSAMHFIYEILWQNSIVGIFAPVNESVWEQGKLVLWPALLWWLIYVQRKDTKYAINRKKWLVGALTALATELTAMPLLYYGYTGALGVEWIWADILILFLSLALGQLLGLHVYRHGRGIDEAVVMSIFAVLVLLFAFWTFRPPQLPWFRDGVTGEYGTLAAYEQGRGIQDRLFGERNDNIPPKIKMSSALDL